MNNSLLPNKCLYKCQSLSKAKNREEIEHGKTPKSSRKHCEGDTMYMLLAPSIFQSSIHSCD